MSFRILFAGTPEIAVPSLERLHESHEIVGVLTNPDREAGRGRRISFSPVKEKALELGLPVFQPDKLDAEFRGEVTALDPDILVAVAYGKIFGPKFLALFPSGGVNLHPSLLPKYRGPSPINAAILAGDQETGITVQRLALEMDAGDILLQERVPLTGAETAGTLTAFAAERGAALLDEALRLLEDGRAVPRPQDGASATFCGLLTREMGRIDWGRSAVDIDRLIRAFTPAPGAWTTFRGETLRILSASPAGSDSETVRAGSVGEGRRPKPGKILGVDKKRGILVQTGQGILAVTELQLQSKKAMDHRSFANGIRDFDGAFLGE